MAPDRPTHIELKDRVVFRVSAYDSPLWASENSEPGRWNTTGGGPTQYMSMHPTGSWAEMVRAQGLRTEDDAALLNMRVWAIRLVHEAHIADYSTFQRAEDAGFSPGALVDDDHSRCRTEGQRLRSLGFRGVLAPSAALPSVLNLTLFGGRREIPWEELPMTASALPCAAVAKGHPQPGLVPNVRQIGDEHAGYAQYLAA